MPIKVEIDKVIEGLDFEKSVDKLTQSILLDSAKLLIKLINEKAPKKSGEYARSWGIQKTSSESITVGSPHEKLFLILEYGRSKVTPKKKKVLHWVDDSGQDVFVMYSGATQPQPHLRPALVRFEKELPFLIKDKVKRHWKVK